MLLNKSSTFEEELQKGKNKRNYPSRKDTPRRWREALALLQQQCLLNRSTDST